MDILIETTGVQSHGCGFTRWYDGVKLRAERAVIANVAPREIWSRMTQGTSAPKPISGKLKSVPPRARHNDDPPCDGGSPRIGVPASEHLREFAYVHLAPDRWTKWLRTYATGAWLGYLPDPSLSSLLANPQRSTPAARPDGKACALAAGSDGSRPDQRAIASGKISAHWIGSMPQSQWPNARLTILEGYAPGTKAQNHR